MVDCGECLCECVVCECMVCECECECEMCLPNGSGCYMLSPLPHIHTHWTGLTVDSEEDCK